MLVHVQVSIEPLPTKARKKHSDPSNHSVRNDRSSNCSHLSDSTGDSKEAIEENAFQRHKICGNRCGIEDTSFSKFTSAGKAGGHHFNLEDHQHRGDGRGKTGIAYDRAGSTRKSWT